MMAPSKLGELVLAEAMTWVGTPYRHQGRRKGVGCDCSGLVLGVWQAIYCSVFEVPAAYSQDWGESGGEEMMFDIASQNFIAKQSRDLTVGDLILFRWRPHLPAKHCGIAASGDSFVHAYEGHAVAVSPIGGPWRRRIAGVFAFPDR